MIKKMSDMTSNDKELFLEATKQAMKREHELYKGGNFDDGIE